jgi:hypothetical protein
MGLRVVLNELIKSKGYVSLKEIEELTDKLGYKRSNAERRLRKSESPSVEAVMSNGAIVGYKYVSDIVRRFEALKKPQPEKIASLF